METCECPTAHEEKQLIGQELEKGYPAAVVATLIESKYGLREPVEPRAIESGADLGSDYK